MRFQFFRVALPGHADHKRKSAFGTRSDTRDGVLDYSGTLRHHPKHLRGLQKGIGRRLTGKTLLDQHIAIDARIEEDRQLLRRARPLGNSDSRSPPRF